MNEKEIINAIFYLLRRGNSEEIRTAIYALQRLLPKECLRHGFDYSCPKCGTVTGKSCYCAKCGQRLHQHDEHCAQQTIHITISQAA